MYIQAKGLLQTKTFWLAAIQAVGAAVLVFQGTYPDAGWLLMAKSIIDIGLRLYTAAPVTGITGPAQ